MKRGFGSEELIKKRRAIGGGPMEAHGNSPNGGEINLTMEFKKIVSRYARVIEADGTTNLVLQKEYLFAVKKYAQVTQATTTTLLIHPVPDPTTQPTK